MNTLFIDIETIRCQREDLNNELALRVQAPSTYKDPEKIQAYRAAKMDTVIDQTALDGTFGEIVCIGFALDNESVQTLTRRPGKSEADILVTFMELVYNNTNFRTHPLWVGHNVMFDIRFLWQRFVINKIPMPLAIPHNAQPWSQGIFDTMHQWGGKEFRNHGLEMLCKVFNLPPKPFKSDSVGQLWEDGKYDDIATLCAHDVEMVRELYKRMVRVRRSDEVEK